MGHIKGAFGAQFSHGRGNLRQQLPGHAVERGRQFQIITEHTPAESAFILKAMHDQLIGLNHIRLDAADRRLNLHADKYDTAKIGHNPRNEHSCGIQDGFIHAFPFIAIFALFTLPCTTYAMGYRFWPGSGQ